MTRAHGKYALVADEEGIKENSGLRGPTRKRLAVLLTVVIFGFGAILLLIAGTERRGPSVLWLATENGEGAPNSGDEHAHVGNSAHAEASIAGRGEETVETVETDFRLTTWPSLIEDGGDLVVFWYGAAETPLRKEDYITLSCGPTLGDHDYFRRKSVTEIDASDNSVRFSELYMMRCNYTAVYFSYQLNSSSFKAIARVEVGMRESFATPKHGHLSLTTEASEMVIMFNSASSKTPVVRYGETAQDLSLHATGMSATYSANDMCHAPATITGQQLFRDPGFMHTVVMTGLKPDRYYFYQYGHEAHVWSKVLRFKSRSAASKKQVNFIAYADMGTFSEPGSASTAMRVYEDVEGGGYDSFLLHFGDVSYARSEGSVWDHFFHLIEPYATRTPYMVSVGNHEYDYTSGGEHDLSGGMEVSGGSFRPSWGNFGNDSKGECGVPMHHRWHAPNTGNWIYWYSFDYGGVHVIQMSTEHNWTRGSEQYKWLQQDLEQVDRNVTPWVVLTGHRMMYSTQLGMEPEMKVASHFRDEVEDLIHKHRVNLMMVGHQHAYERSCPVYRKECVPDGKATVHVVAGSAGYPLDTADFSTKYGNWSIRHVNEYGYLRIMSDPEIMRVQFVLNKNGNVYDEFTITPWE